MVLLLDDHSPFLMDKVQKAKQNPKSSKIFNIVACNITNTILHPHITFPLSRWIMAFDFQALNSFISKYHFESLQDVFSFQH